MTGKHLLLAIEMTHEIDKSQPFDVSSFEVAPTFCNDNFINVSTDSRDGQRRHLGRIPDEAGRAGPDLPPEGQPLGRNGHEL